jgi:hypothetical protein
VQLQQQVPVTALQQQQLEANKHLAEALGEWVLAVCWFVNTAGNVESLGSSRQGGAVHTSNGSVLGMRRGWCSLHCCPRHIAGSGERVQEAQRQAQQAQTMVAPYSMMSPVRASGRLQACCLHLKIRTLCCCACGLLLCCCCCLCCPASCLPPTHPTRSWTHWGPSPASAFSPCMCTPCRGSTTTTVSQPAAQKDRHQHHALLATNPNRPCSCSADATAAPSTCRL